MEIVIVKFITHSLEKKKKKIKSQKNEGHVCMNKTEKRLKRRNLETSHGCAIDFIKRKAQLLDFIFFNTKFLSHILLKWQQPKQRQSSAIT